MEKLREKARLLKDSGQYEQAITVYNELVLDSDQSDKWVLWEYAKCLKEVGKIDEAIDVSKSLHLREKTFVYNNDLLGWLLYEKYFKVLKENYSYIEINKMFDIADYITKVVKYKDGSAYELITLRMVKILKDNKSKAYNKILSMLNRLDSKKLSKVPPTYTHKNRKKEYQSNKEMYYSAKSKALLELEQYEECLSLCTEALEDNITYHHNNDIWISVRKAICIGKTRSIEESIQLLKDSAKKLPHYNIYQKIGDGYRELGQVSKALLYYCISAMATGPTDDSMKVRLYINIAIHLYEQGDMENALNHALYVKQIEESKGWEINNKVKEIIKNVNLDTYKVNIEDLRGYWTSIIDTGIGSQNGTIIKIHSNNKFGFIKGKEKSYFFKIASVLDRKRVNPGDKVKFCLIDSFDRSKKIDTKEAAYIRVLKGE